MTVFAIVGLAIAALAFAFIMFVLRVNKVIRSFEAENVEAIAAAARGDYAKARTIFERWQHSSTLVVEQTARHGLASVLTREGKLHEALELMTKARERLSATPPTALDATAFASLHGLLGNLEEAGTWLAKAQDRSAAQGAAYPAVAALARAVLYIRSGRHAEAARYLDEHWMLCEELLAGQRLRALRVVRAFAHAAGGPREAGAADRMLEGARPPAYPGEYDFLATAWPEMAAFLASHELTKKTSSL